MKTKHLILILASLTVSALIAVNLFHTYNRTNELQEKRQQNTYDFYGDRVIDMADIFKNETHIGYYTDAPVDSSAHPLAIHHLAHFQQIQLQLAPAIVELNNTTHKYVLIYCSDPRLTIQKIIELKAKPLMKRPDGLVLVQTKS